MKIKPYPYKDDQPVKSDAIYDLLRDYYYIPSGWESFTINLNLEDIISMIECVSTLNFTQEGDLGDNDAEIVLGTGQ